jgi:hypothetical protein
MTVNKTTLPLKGPPYAGVLVGAYQSGGTGSTRAAYAADGYFMYYQGGLSQLLAPHPVQPGRG